ncbi:MAG: MBL fold metallo-hydrolase [Rhodobiaceae bacterium]|nr:MBL fold metallo-hydrolase [Rhodobiaceae bacterium]MCC0012377.1 MBL fold metallo-hydrolase [Rhodobiaceae bacterium]
MPTGDFRIRFWGVRGSIATCAPDICRYGGETISMEVICGSRTLIFDVGSGGRRLGNDLSARGVCNVDVFISHYHYDHVEGLPFFHPLYREECKIRIHSGHGTATTTTNSLVRGFIAPPYFPICPDMFRANWTCTDMAVGADHDLGDGITITTFALNHPGGATGYRIGYGGHAIAIVTDNEHVIGRTDEALGKFIAGADLVVYDAMYTDIELPAFVGYGHSTWEEGVRLCEAFDAGKLALMHHRPMRTDAELDALGNEAETRRPGTFFARQGQEIIVG